MKRVTPRVFLVAEPCLRLNDMAEYLQLVGGQRWLDRVTGAGTSGAEALIEFAGRSCYRSWEPGLNLNVTRVRDDSAKYIGNILSSKHGSVLEHAQISFMFSNVSRVFTHELVRHRAGVAISQESGRFVRLGEISTWIPPIIEGKPELVKRWISIVESVEDWQRDAAKEFDLDSGDVPFDVKKEVTSALRRLSPFGHASEMIWSANLRTIRHVLEMRTEPTAEEEMRLVFGAVGVIVRERYPMVFQDFDRDTTGTWISLNRKV